MASSSITPMESMRGTLTSMSTEFEAALPPQISVDKFIRTTLTAVQMNPDLLQADRKTLLGTCMKAAQDGLMLDGREAAPVIFGGKGGKTVAYMPMVGGILKKIRNSGELASISAQVAYSNDMFDYQLGDDEKIIHKPLLGGDRGTPIAVYCIAHTKDGAIYREVMSLDDVEKVRRSSRAGSFGPWKDWWDEMAKKTVIRRISKRLPSSADVDAVMQADLEASGFEKNQPVNITPTPDKKEKPMSRLKEAIGMDKEGAEKAAKEVIKELNDTEE